MEQKNAYSTWITDEWSKQGGLITPATASKILKLTRGRIAQLQKTGKLTEIKDPEGKTMLSLPQILKIEEERIRNNKIKHSKENPPK